MKVVHLGSFDTPEEALDLAHAQGEVIRVVLIAGTDHRIRGTVLLQQESNDGDIS